MIGLPMPMRFWLKVYPRGDMPFVILAGVVLLPIWLILGILSSPLLLFAGKPPRVSRCIWKLLPDFMQEAADLN